MSQPNVTVPIKRRNLDTATDTRRKSDMKTREEDGHLQDEGHGCHWELGDRPGTDQSSRPRRSHPADASIPDSRLCTVRTHVCGFSHHHPPTPGAAPENEYTYFTWLCLQSSISCPSTFTHSTHSRQVCEHLLWASARAQTRKCNRATGERPGGAGALTEQGRIPLSILA